MLGLVLDAGVLVGLVMMLNQDEAPKFWTAVAAAFAISIVTYGAAFALASLGGLIVLLLIIPLAALIAAGVLWIVFDVPLPRAAIGGGLFLLYKVVFAALMFSMMSTP